MRGLKAAARRRDRGGRGGRPGRRRSRTTRSAPTTTSSELKGETAADVQVIVFPFRVAGYQAEAGRSRASASTNGSATRRAAQPGRRTRPAPPDPATSAPPAPRRCSPAACAPTAAGAWRGPKLSSPVAKTTGRGGRAWWRGRGRATSARRMQPHVPRLFRLTRTMRDLHMRVSTADFIKNYGALADQALSEPVTITKNGRDRLVVMSAAEYARLKGRDRRVCARSTSTRKSWRCWRYPKRPPSTPISTRSSTSRPSDLADAATRPRRSLQLSLETGRKKASRIGRAPLYQREPRQRDVVYVLPVTHSPPATPTTRSRRNFRCDEGAPRTRCGAILDRGDGGERVRLARPGPALRRRRRSETAAYGMLPRRCSGPSATASPRASALDGQDDAAHGVGQRYDPGGDSPGSAGRGGQTRRYPD